MVRAGRRILDMRCLAVRTAAAMLILASGATVLAQSLADLSRQEEERRKAIGTPGKVYTNERLRQEPPPSGAPAATPAAAAAPSSGAPTTPSGSTPAPAGATPSGARAAAAAPADASKSEDVWRTRVAAEREALKRAQMFADALQSQINGLTTEFENRGDPAQRSVIEGKRKDALAELDRVKKEVLEHQKAITTIQDEARRAGVPAGWTR